MDEAPSSKTTELIVVLRWDDGPALRVPGNSFGNVATARLGQCSAFGNVALGDVVVQRRC